MKSVILKTAGIWSCCILMLLIGILPGCSWFSGTANPVKAVSKLWRSADSGLVMRIGISPISPPKSTLEPGALDRFQQSFEEQLRGLKIPAVWVGPGAPDCPDFIKSPSINPAGAFDNVAFARESRKWGFQGLVRISLLAYDVHERSTGYLWFQKSVEEGRFLWNIAVYDSETGAKMDEVLYPATFKADENDLKLIREGRVRNVQEGYRAAEKSLATLAKTVSDILADLPWKGFVTEVAADRIVLSSGSEAGLTVGRELALASPATLFEGKDGQQFFLPGKTIGKVRITSVSPNRAEAVVLDGVQAEKGSTVRSIR